MEPLALSLLISSARDIVGARSIAFRANNYKVTRLKGSRRLERVGNLSGWETCTSKVFGSVLGEYTE